MLNEEKVSREYLCDLIFDILLYRPGLTRIDRLTKLLPAPLELAPSFVAEVLGGDARFFGLFGNFDLAYRGEVGQKPLSGAASTILKAYGKPIERPALVAELSAIGSRQQSAPDTLVDRLLSTGELAELGDGYLYTPNWLFTPYHGLSRERILYLNDLADDPSVGELIELCASKKLGSRSLVQTAANIIETVNEPVSSKVLGLLVGLHQGDQYNPAELLRQMFDDVEDRFVFLSGQRCFLSAQLSRLVNALHRQSPETAPLAQKIVDMSALLSKPIDQAKTYDLSAIEISVLLELIASHKASFTLAQLLSDVLGITPNQRKYAAAAQAVERFLMSVPGLLQLQVGRYLKHSVLPANIRTIPLPLQVEEWQAEFDKNGMLQSDDVLLAAEGLHPAAAESAADPFYDDIGEYLVASTTDETVSTETQYPVLYHHYMAGTMRLRACDLGFFSDEPSVSAIDLKTDDGLLLSVWLCRETGLLGGLQAWYYHTRLPISGGLLTIRQTDEAGLYTLSCGGKTDSQTYIRKGTIKSLFELRQRTANRPVSLRELILFVLDEQGQTFNQLWAQLNILRRTTRAQLASVLSLFSCFEYGDGKHWSVIRDAEHAGYRKELLPYVRGFVSGESDAHSIGISDATE